MNSSLPTDDSSSELSLVVQGIYEVVLDLQQVLVRLDLQFVGDGLMSPAQSKMVELESKIHFREGYKY